MTQSYKYSVDDGSISRLPYFVKLESNIMSLIVQEMREHFNNLHFLSIWRHAACISVFRRSIILSLVTRYLTFATRKKIRTLIKKIQENKYLEKKFLLVLLHSTYTVEKASKIPFLSLTSIYPFSLSLYMKSSPNRSTMPPFRS